VLGLSDLGTACVAELQVAPFSEMKVIADLVAMEPKLLNENGGQVWPNRISETGIVTEEYIGIYNADLLEIADLQRIAEEALTKESDSNK